jgi:triphosphatase
LRRIWAWADRVRKHAPLKRSWRKVARRAERLEELTVEERHLMRKALKALRYGVESSRRQWWC